MPVNNYLVLGESTTAALGESTTAALGESTTAALGESTATFGESVVAGLSEPALSQATNEAATTRAKNTFFIFFEF